jgi:benzoyl-CoA reductase/2-hydroxyglutaryl-CoA dehydratase subunit BcrC/BadD/HgdB
MQVALIDEPVRFTEKLNQLNTELEERINKGVSPFSKGTKRIMFSGCPAVIGNWKVHSLIEKSGAVIVIDESCTGTRYFENLVDEQPTDLEGQLLAIADRYLKINCACFTPNQERIDGLVQKTKNYNVNGVIQYILQYCHGYNVEAIRVEGALKSANVPSLKIETDYSEEDIGPLRTRIEAFIERLA